MMRMITAILGCGLSFGGGEAFAAPDSSPLDQATESFTIVLKGSVAEVTPLFGPVRETEWAPSWKPHFIHSPEGGQHEGTVFRTTSSNGRERLWLLTAYDEEAGRVEYVFFAPGFTINQVKIRVVRDGDQQCRATITYCHSALGPAGNEEVAKLNSHWAEQQRVHWEKAINTVLAAGKAHD